jgi:hypothetical protein
MLSCYLDDPVLQVLRMRILKTLKHLISACGEKEVEFQEIETGDQINLPVFRSLKVSC